MSRCGKNAPDSHPDACACRLKISVVMLDAPLELPWDLSVEMAAYLFRLEHVSADCLLTPEEELTLLKKCICDAADRRYDKATHSPLGVALCKNRRTALRARVVHQRGAADGALPLGAEPACTIELPRRGDDKWSGWVYQWHPTCLEETAEGLEALLEETVMKFKHERTFYMEVSIEGILGMPCTMSCTMSCTM